jgi:hypothetical protein
VKRVQDIKEFAAMEPLQRSALSWEIIRELSFLAKEPDMGIGETPPPEPIEEPPQPRVEGHEHTHFFLPVDFDDKGEPIPLDVPDVDPTGTGEDQGDDQGDDQRHDQGHDEGPDGGHDHNE